MSPQRSSRQQFLDGTIGCLELLPPDQFTARVIAKESGANLASILYHFGSKDRLVTEAMVATLDRWLDQVVQRIASRVGVFVRRPVRRGPGQDAATQLRRVASRDRGSAATGSLTAG